MSCLGVHFALESDDGASARPWDGEAFFMAAPCGAGHATHSGCRPPLNRVAWPAVLFTADRPLRQSHIAPNGGRRPPRGRRLNHLLKHLVPS